jgi:hypothetical protein
VTEENPRRAAIAMIVRTQNPSKLPGTSSRFAADDAVIVDVVVVDVVVVDVVVAADVVAVVGVVARLNEWGPTQVPIQLSCDL